MQINYSASWSRNLDTFTSLEAARMDKARDTTQLANTSKVFEHPSDNALSMVRK